MQGGACGRRSINLKPLKWLAPKNFTNYHKREKECEIRE